MARFKNTVWNLSAEEADRTVSNEHIKMALMMDLRDEMQALNRVMACQNVMAGFIALQSIDRTLKRIDKRLAKKVKLP